MYIDNCQDQQHSQSKEIPMYYSGIDLHSDNCYITTLNDNALSSNNNASRISTIRSFPTSTRLMVLIKLSLNLPPAGTGSTIYSETTASILFLLMPNTSKPLVMLKLKQIKLIRKPLPFSYDKALFHRLIKSAANCEDCAIPCVCAFSWKR